MSIIKIEDVAFVRFRAPDLAVMRSFLEDFGLVIVVADETRIVSRGAGTEPVAHIIEFGEPGFAGVGFRAASIADLHLLAATEGVPVEPFDAPGGGLCVRLTDPDGLVVEVVAGQADTACLPLPSPQPWNSALSRRRVQELKRVAAGAAHVIRLGHVVLNVSDFRASEAWYKRRFGFITSDEVEIAPGHSLGAFLRCDRGETPTDHHTLFLLQHPEGAGFNHAAFEVADLDDLMIGHQRLKVAGHRPEWGVGRHILGGQVFDYWRDPCGNTLEHWTDGDLLTTANGSNFATVQDLGGVQWGAATPST
jgi:catechol 2,3-dioxygenase-like lactoylglutathione lyase family enzyme